MNFLRLWVSAVAVLAVSCSSDPEGSGSGGGDTVSVVGTGTSSASTAATSGAGGAAAGGGGEGGGPVVVGPSCEPNRYVTAAATGDGDGTIGAPWTLSQAMDNAVAGDVVRVAPGIYVGDSTDDGTAPSFRPAHDGTADQPIVFCAEYPAALETDATRWSRIRRNGPVDSPLMGAGGQNAYRSHIVFDGFYFSYAEDAMPFPRGIVYAGGGNTGIKFRRMRFDRMNLGDADDGDNFNCIQIHGSSNVEITDNVFSGGLDPEGSHNESVITTYGASNFVIEHNLFDGVTTGIYVKGANEGVGNSGRISYNRFTGFRSGIELTTVTQGDETVEVSHNVFYDWPSTSYAAIVFENSVNAWHRNFVVHHNTIVAPIPAGSGGPVYVEEGIAMTNDVFADNLVITLAPGNTQVLFNAWEVASLAPFSSFDHNVYDNAGGQATFAIAGSVVTGIDAWRAASGRDMNGLVVTPDLKSPSTHDYRLVDNGQPARSASSTGGPVGAYVTNTEELGPRISPPYE